MFIFPVLVSSSDVDWPTRKAMGPPAPAVASPEERLREPVDPLIVLPVYISIYPLPPSFVSTSFELMSRFPLLASSPVAAPEEKCSLPPVPASKVLAPATSVTLPPDDESNGPFPSPSDTVTLIAPPEPPMASPDWKINDPDNPLPELPV
jgi:hypothetical protein